MNCLKKIFFSFCFIFLFGSMPAKLSPQKLKKEIASFEGSKEDLASLYYKLANILIDNSELISAITKIDECERRCGKYFLIFPFEKLKLHIATEISNGAYCRLFGISFLPKWQRPYSRAIEIADKLIAVSSDYDLVISARFVKAKSFMEMNEWYFAVDCLQEIIDEFGDSSDSLKAKVDMIYACAHILSKCSLDYSIFDLGKKSYEDVVNSPKASSELVMSARSAKTELDSVLIKNIGSLEDFYLANNNKYSAELAAHLADNILEDSSVLG